MMTCRVKNIAFQKWRTQVAYVYTNLSVHTRKSSVQLVISYYNPFNIQFGLLYDVYLCTRLRSIAEFIRK